MYIPTLKIVSHIISFLWIRVMFSLFLVLPLKISNRLVKKHLICNFGDSETCNCSHFLINITYNSFSTLYNIIGRRRRRGQHQTSNSIYWNPQKQRNVFIFHPTLFVGSLLPLPMILINQISFWKGTPKRDI